MTFAEETAKRQELGARAVGILEAILVLGQLADPSAAEQVVREWYESFQGDYKPRTLQEIVGERRGNPAYDDDWRRMG